MVCTPEASAPKASAATGAPAIPNPNLPVPTDANIPRTILAEGNVAKRSKSEATTPTGDGQGTAAGLAQPVDTRAAAPTSPSSSSSTSSKRSPTSPAADPSSQKSPTSPGADYEQKSPTSPGGPYERVELVPAPSARAELTEGPGAVISATGAQPATTDSEDDTHWTPPAEPPLPGDDQLAPMPTHPLPTHPTELQLQLSFGTLSEAVMMNLLIDPKPSMDCIVILDDPTISEDEKIFKKYSCLAVPW